MHIGCRLTRLVRVQNLFYLTNTLNMAAQMEPRLKQRVVVLPLGAGASLRGAQLQLQGGGSALVSSSFARTFNSSTASIRIIPLDELLQPRFPIHMLKADVQGLECEVLRGAARSLASTQAAAVELDERLLRRQGCSPPSIRRALESSGFFVSRTQTMSEATAFAHRCGLPNCKKDKHGVSCFLNSSSLAGSTCRHRAQEGGQMRMASGDSYDEEA